jgi:hypothetical protein
VVSRHVDAPAAAVWDVLSDGWLYASWVVGASRVRDVDPGWPSAGSRIQHSFGAWPAVINDDTVILAVDEQEMLLRARGRPAGEAEVRLVVTADTAERSTVSIVEDVTAGPGRIVPQTVRQWVIAPRNVEALRRLSLIAEGRHRQSQ